MTFIVLQPHTRAATRKAKPLSSFALALAVNDVVDAIVMYEV